MLEQATRALWTVVRDAREFEYRAFLFDQHDVTTCNQFDIRNWRQLEKNGKQDLNPKHFVEIAT